jgi:UDP-N-acetylmuramoyl-L-alanyl-D-glutamate--2,6-diaminopimelate ligase
MLAKLKNIYHFCLAWLGAVIYGFPSRRIIVVGITGTKGKTTSVELLHSVLEQAGRKTAMLSSAHISTGGAVAARDGNTMPGRFFIQRFLRQAVESGCKYAVFEVTSQGVVQHRHRFIAFDIAAITCLHPEHIESHGGYEQYRGAKVKFFRDTAHFSAKPDKKFFINSDMATGGDAQFFEQAAMHPTGRGHFGEIMHYSRQNFLRNELGGDKALVSEWLQGDFNLENTALVFAIARSMGIPSEVILKACKEFAGVAGRLEFVRPSASSGQVAKAPTVVIDYALTPGSLRAVYTHLKTLLRPDGKLIAVFGSAGGGRDTWKRPELGKIADELCDRIYLTTDDSYDEKTEDIVAEIQEGIFNITKCKVVIDRAAAITEALRSAGPNDIVAITGMGSQMHTYGPNGKKTDWSDRKAVEGALAQL